VSPRADAAAEIAVLGAGSWGTALAIQCARAGRPARLWGRDRAHTEAMRRERVNRRYLPDAVFPDTLKIESNIEAALAGAHDVLVAVPSHAFRALLTQIRPLLAPGQRLCWATKGFEVESAPAEQVAREVLGSPGDGGALRATFARGSRASL
jgi:glycerol-3-phosphate dehydrogenase (NAD(P)+)